MNSDSDRSGGGPELDLGLVVDQALLEAALTHSSYAHENPQASGDNQRLEFLGDAVLQLAVGSLLYRRFPEASAGELTRLRAAVVSEEALWRAAEGLGLGRSLRLGRGEELSGGRRRRSVLADAFEAVVGAVYLSAGARRTQRFVERCLGPLLDAARSRPLLDPKTALQEDAQATGQTVVYRMAAASGPEHNRVFEVTVEVGGELTGRGQGGSKREAEQAAAREAMASRKTPT